ncbi:hypothetical protein PA25_31880 [Pseudoalteromonas sp. A25]|uniref:histidine phosphatase family protein n=1 Tax=Pseudoalteromonas sp. A25 TaxID=116092 RepID=UPI00126122D1|nr:histidine phosphatase family protein [Pseudoalteromonas sp. A25]BBN83203.1 hypothetical protein PA25_31880 [Pseudoalteromonas sp. A25]
MTTRLIVVRHGNTFLPTDTPTRVGARTDLDLVEQTKSTSVGHYLRDNHLSPDVVYAGPLKRHQQTAQLICEVLNLDVTAIKLDEFLNEIDYGPDENQVEEMVMKRLGGGDIALGKQVIERWNRDAQVPEGWLVNPDALRMGWRSFAQNLLTNQADKTTLMVSSNGIMRFSHVIDSQFGFSNLKVPTGGICIFENMTGKVSDWRCVEWGLTPSQKA